MRSEGIFGNELSLTRTPHHDVVASEFPLRRVCPFPLDANFPEEKSQFQESARPPQRNEGWKIPTVWIITNKQNKKWEYTPL